MYGVSFTDANTGNAVGDNGTIIRTTNGGLNWISQNSGTLNSLWGVSFTDANYGTAVGDWSTIIRTTNGGTNWTSQTSGTTALLYSVSFTDENNGTVVGAYGTILKTTNGGLNWISQISGTANSLKSVSFTDANYGTAVGIFGTILRTTNGGTFVNQISSKIPERYSLYQNYPNPFNPTTNIKFDMQKTSVTKLIIFDALGREVATLVNEELKAGSYQVSWPAPMGDGSGYTSGVYFYTLQSEDYIETKKMLLLK